jgi:SAM-dependent methyltransferase
VTFDAFNEWERTSWEARAEAYARGLQQMTRGSVDDLLDAVQAVAGSRVLDIGCGPGPLSAAAVARGCRVSGVDVSEKMLAIARAAVPDADLRSGSAEQLPFDDSAFDAVCGNFVLPHVGYPDRALAEALRVVRPGGRVAFTDWDRERAMPLAVFWKIVRASGMPMPPDAPPGPESAHTESDGMRQVFEAAGAIDIEVHHSTWIYVVDPDEWWDAILAATPRTGAAIMAAPPDAQRALRAQYDELVAEYAVDQGEVAFPVTAIIGSGRRP